MGVAALIEKCELFQLLWSANCEQSAQARAEWEHARARGQKGLVIRGLFWQRSMPAAPPAELTHCAFTSLGEVATRDWHA